MSNSPQQPDLRSWWARLGLDVVGVDWSGWHAPRVRKEIERVLATVEPIGFRRKHSDDVLTMGEIIALIHGTADDVQCDAERSDAEKSELRRIEVSRLVEQVLTAPDAQDPIAEGRWAGFTRGEALAWCWNLFQYEPQGFILPNSWVREEAMRKLEAGELPEIFRYPERARELAEFGLTPRTYREHKHALRATTYSPDLVRIKMDRGFRVE